MWFHSMGQYMKIDSKVPPIRLLNKSYVYCGNEPENTDLKRWEPGYTYR